MPRNIDREKELIAKDKKLGKVTDVVIARKWGVTPSIVQKIRANLGIEAFNKPRNSKLCRADFLKAKERYETDQSLHILPVSQVTKELKVGERAVRTWRKALGHQMNIKPSRDHGGLTKWQRRRPPFHKKQKEAMRLLRGWKRSAILAKHVEEIREHRREARASS